MMTKMIKLRSGDGEKGGFGFEEEGADERLEKTFDLVEWGFCVSWCRFDDFEGRSILDTLFNKKPNDITFGLSPVYC